ncbi:MAG: hypothetical protein IKB98_10720 [Clostridia bacterium]|nr:hypothetical protein [Clostridia bacterium]MBR2871822.1 hypothetical protein [Clostridia bacterium]
MMFNPYDVRWSLHNTNLEIFKPHGTEVIIIKDSSSMKVANIERTSVNYYILSVCDFNNSIITTFKYNTLKSVIEYLKVWFSPGERHKRV